METIRDFIGFMSSHKKYWLAPIFIVLFLVGLLIFFAQSSPVSPFIYTIF